MDRDLERRIAGNETIFRDVNEALRAGRWPGEDASPVSFRCECAKVGCNQLIDMLPSDYERIRLNPRRFFMVHDHNIPEVERVVERHKQYIVVEKVGEGGSVAEETAPS